MYSFANMFTSTLERGILEALAYSDIFDYPLRLSELHRYLPSRVEIEQLSIALESLSGRVGNRDDFYFLTGRDEIVGIRKQREVHSRTLMPRALKYGSILGSLPFARMVALTGSLAVMNSSKNADFDYLLITVPGRVWTTRAFALLFNRVTRLFGDTICPNLIVSENKLEWAVNDLYSARELCQMIPVSGLDVYQRLMKANEWVKEFLPNAYSSLQGERSSTKQSLPSNWRLLRRSFQSLLAMTEDVLRGKLGDSFEQWEMNRKIARFSKQAGFGEETVFTAEVCQGNFDHHRKWTEQMLENKLSALETEVTVTFKVTVT